MQSPLPTTTASSRPPASVASQTTYTTIPISGNDVISRSLQNTTSYFSLCRPWPEFFDVAVFDRPESLSLAGERLRKNASYFRLNYAFIVIACVLLSLLGTPFYLVLFSAISALWLILYIFREDELILWGSYHLTDRMVLVGLVSLSLVTLLFTGILGNLLFGVGIGMSVSAVHGSLRNPDGLFLNEDEAASSGLIAGSRPVSRLKNVVDH